jgi:hypothetical protein
MNGQRKSGETPRGAKDARAKRLAAALRANLKRRKQQARVREAAKDTDAALKSPGN